MQRLRRGANAVYGRRALALPEARRWTCCGSFTCVLVAWLGACGDEAKVADFVEPAYADPCKYVDCAGYGVCMPDDGGAPACLCELGRVGDRCQSCASGYHLAANGECLPDQYCRQQPVDPCGAHGTCTDEGGALGCQCDRGYDGARCELCASGYARNDVGDCLQLVITNGGQTQSVGGTCTATSCSGHGECRDTDGSTNCKCAAGYDGTRCDLCAPGYALSGDSCVATHACGTGSCGECEGFNGAAGFPNTTDNCVSQSSLTLDDAKFSSLGGDGSVWLCGASSIYGIMSQHLALVAGPSQPARISFAAPVVSVSFSFAARSFDSSQGLALEVAGDGHVIGSIMQDASKVGSWSHHFDTAIAVFSLRSLGQSNQEIALDDLVFEPAMCK